MFIAAVMIGSILGYAAAALTVMIGLPYAMALAVLIVVGMLGTLATAGISVLQHTYHHEDLIPA
jgi:hypothetical protein